MGRAEDLKSRRKMSGWESGLGCIRNWLFSKGSRNRRWELSLRHRNLPGSWFSLSVFCSVLMKVSSPAAGVRHARPRPGTLAFGAKKGNRGYRGEQGRACWHPWTGNGERLENGSNYAAKTAQDLFFSPEAECYRLACIHSPQVFPFLLFPPSKPIWIWSDAGRDSLQPVPSPKWCVGNVWETRSWHKPKLCQGVYWWGTAGCSGPVLFTGRNTAKLFVDLERRIYNTKLILGDAWGAQTARRTTRAEYMLYRQLSAIFLIW